LVNVLTNWLNDFLLKVILLLLIMMAQFNSIRGNSKGRGIKRNGDSEHDREQIQKEIISFCSWSYHCN